MVIEIRFGDNNGAKKEKQYKCCICWNKFTIEEFSYGNKYFVENFHVCKDCAQKESIRNKLMEMIRFYYDDPKRKPGLRYRMGAFVKKDSFSYVVTRAWILAQEKMKNEKKNINLEQKRNNFLKMAN